MTTFYQEYIADYINRTADQQRNILLENWRILGITESGPNNLRINIGATPVRPVERINITIDIPSKTSFGQEKEQVQTVNITPSGAIIENAKHRIPELAKASLDKYSNSRVKELKLVTKAFKTKFPFYHPQQQKRSYNKIFEIIRKALERNIPYVADTTIPFMEIPITSNGGGTINMRIGPFTTVDDAKVEIRYVRYLGYLIRRYALPLTLSGRVIRYLKPPTGSTGRYGTAYTNKEEEYKNTYEVMEIKISLNAATAEHGYLILFYLEQIIKVVETLHRKAHYAPTTFRAPQPTNVGNR